MVGNGTNVETNDYLYGGKELQQRFGVNLYDSGARFQSNTGAFTSPDPLAEKYYSISPYAYCAGNPVNLVDSEGENAGDYYSYGGEYIASDGLVDNRIYLIDNQTIAEYNTLDQRFVSFEINYMVLNENAKEVDGLIIISRDNDDSITKGKFQAIGENGFGGYTLEPSGEPTTESNKNKPIPTGYYDTEPRAEGDYAGGFAFRIYNEIVPKSRGILGHIGNTTSNTKGCVLFGMSRNSSGVSQSANAMENYRQFFNGKSNVKLIIR